jgi:mono/diheme cytochrome c family protein
VKVSNRIAFVALFAVACSSAQPSTPAPTPQPSAPVSAPVPPTQSVVAVPAGPSTLDSVYTMEQAERGRDVYFGTCRSCHTQGYFTTPSFETHWRGKHLSELYTYLLTKMPGNDPGSLSPEATADVLAYVLRLNRMPPGASELWPDADSLKKYVIATVK